ncbi:MAG: carboxyl-terminal processing protease, partial [Thermomicrobiales bacterium]|nr:carboxyl-terminal processing protease [Thermomicrobiales bacterium]
MFDADPAQTARGAGRPCLAAERTAHRRLVGRQNKRGTVDAYYLDRTFAGVDWPALRNAFEARVRGAQSVEEFYALIVQMVARLGDQHTRYAPPWQVATEVALA